jgi:hypothetical protein
MAAVGGAETALGRVPVQAALPAGTAVEVALRPDDVDFTAVDGASARAANARVVARQFLGIAYLYVLALEGETLVHSWQPHQVVIAPGTPVVASLRPGNVAPAFGV